MYVYIYIYISIYVCVCEREREYVYVCVCVYVCVPLKRSQFSSLDMLWCVVCDITLCVCLCVRVFLCVRAFVCGCVTGVRTGATNPPRMCIHIIFAPVGSWWVALSAPLCAYIIKFPMCLHGSGLIRTYYTCYTYIRIHTSVYTYTYMRVYIQSYTWCVALPVPSLCVCVCVSV